MCSTICPTYRTIASSSIDVIERGAFSGLPNLETLYVDACCAGCEVDAGIIKSDATESFTFFSVF